MSSSPVKKVKVERERKVSVNTLRRDYPQSKKTDIINMVLNNATELELMRQRAEKAELTIKELRLVMEHNQASTDKGLVEYDAIHDLAFVDPLTRLPNRRLLNDRLNQIILNNKRRNSYSAIIFVDLDKFKAVNDTHGHHAGDELLIAAANRLKGCIRESDTVARYGGDEFVVLLDHLDGNFTEAKREAEIIANKLLASLKQIYTLQARDSNGMLKSIEFQSFASLGVAIFDGVMTDKDSVINTADKAMYSAKRAGGNNIEFASEVNLTKLSINDE